MEILNTVPNYDVMRRVGLPKRVIATVDETEANVVSVSAEVSSRKRHVVGENLK